MVAQLSGKGRESHESVWCRAATSAEATKDRFNSEASAAKYAGALEGTSTHRREMRCIRAALAGLPAGSRVLDLPSGTGRMLPLLIEMGFRVTEADSSPHMIQQARDHDRAQGQEVEFRVEDAFATSFEDNAFDAVLCNRLLHHFREPEVRQRCLRELARICKGPIVVSFFCNRSFDAVSFRVRNWLRRRTPTDRIPIARRDFIADAEAVNLRVVQTRAARPVISKQWYAVLQRREEARPELVRPVRPRLGSGRMKAEKLDSSAYQRLIRGGTVLSRNRFGVKVWELNDGQIVKLFRRKRLLSSALCFPYARRFVWAARKLARRGILTVEPSALYKIPAIARQAVVYDKLKGEVLRTALESSADFTGLMQRLADFLALLHDRGVFFRSLHFANVLCLSEERFALIDVSDLRLRSGALPPSLRLRNFRHLTRYEIDRQAIAGFGTERFVSRYFESSTFSARYKDMILRQLTSSQPS